MLVGIKPEVERSETEGQRTITKNSYRGFTVQGIPYWQEPGRTLQDMLLSEPGSRIEGPTEDILRLVYAVVLELGGDTPEADAQALRLLPHLHARLATHGYVVRDYAVE
jgi:hypothetical protein